MMARWFLMVSVVFVLGAPVARAQTVYVVRHAEKVDDSKDPPLNADGAARALALRHVLRDAGVGHVYVTPYVRNKETARPLAELLRVHPRVLPAGDVTGLVAALRKHQAGDVVLVVGHSDTVPELLQKLCGEKVVLQHGDYDNLFVARRDGAGFVLTRLHFGAPRP